MSELPVVGQHMSWCQGTHDKDGECVVEHRIHESLHAELSGVPCDHNSIYVDGVIADAADLAALVAALDELRPLLEQGEVDFDCDRHQHPPGYDDW